MKEKNITRIIVEIIGGIGMGAAAYYGGMHTEGNSMTNTIINNTNTIELGNVAEKSDKEILNWLIQQYNENQEEVKLLNSEKKKLEEKLESANSKIDSLEEQQSSDAENADQEKSNLQAELDESQAKLSELESSNQELLMKLNDYVDVAFENWQIGVDGMNLPSEDKSVALINNQTYFNLNTVERILEYYDKMCKTDDKKMNIISDIDDSKLAISKAQIYDIDSCASTNSGIRSDLNGNEFSGVLINGTGQISFLLNGKYKKMKGAIHVAKETENDCFADIQIWIVDENGNEKSVYEVDGLDNLSKPEDADFSNGINIEGAKIVRIEQHGKWGNIDAIISDAYFYND